MKGSEVVTVVSGGVLVGWAAGADARSAVLARLLQDAGAPDDDVRHECPHCGSTEHGPLRTSSGTTVVSLSHAGGLTVGAIARADAAASVGVDVEAERDADALTAGAIAAASAGIDVEADRGSGRLAELAALFAPRPAPTLREWTMIEAAVKADGRGLRIAPADVRIDGGLAHVPGRGPIAVAAVESPAGFLISVAIDPGSSRPGRGWVR
jgi:4'-phosphopantetheinyl transferase